MRGRLAVPCAVAASVLAIHPPALRAQRVLGPGDDALVLPSGVFRFGTVGSWSNADQRYGAGTTGRPAGSLEPLGIDFTHDTLGVAQFPNLAPLQSGLRALAGMPDFTLSLGATSVSSALDIEVTPIALEYGLTSRLQVGVSAPFVTSIDRITFGINRRQTEGNVGFNPALTNPSALAADTAVVNQFARAATAMNTSLQSCQANPSATGCTAINANRAAILTLIAQASAFAAGLDQIYTSSSFVPVTGTDMQAAIEARVAGFRSLYETFGVTGVITSTGPAGAINRLGVGDAQRLLTDSAFGFAADSLRTSTHSHFGDIEFAAKLLLLDSSHGDRERRWHADGWNWRLAVGGAYILGSGQADSPDEFLDVGTGTGANAVSGRVYADVLRGNHFWVSAVARYTSPFADRQTIRIMDAPDQVFAPLYRRHLVNRQLGTTRELEVTPRWVLNDYMSLSGQWFYRHKMEDRYTGTFAVPASVTGYADLTLDAATNDLETEQTEHRLGFGWSFSTVKAFSDGRTRLPLEVSFFHQQTTRGTLTPKFFTDEVRLRLYLTAFDRSGLRRPPADR